MSIDAKCLTHCDIAEGEWIPDRIEIFEMVTLLEV